MEERGARGGRPTHGEPVVDRALRLLAAFESHETALSLTSLAARAGLSKSTTLRLARRLTDWGALERSENGDYVVGLRLWEVGSLAPRGHGLRAVAMPFMEDLHHVTGQHVLLAVREDLQAVLIERLSAHQAGQVRYRVGGRLPLHSTGVGLVLLAFAPFEVQEQALSGDLPADGDGQDVPGPELRRRLARIRQEGVAVNSQTGTMTAVAAPVFGAGRAVIAALSVIAPSGSMRSAAASPTVVAVARAVSRAMQGTHSPIPARGPICSQDPAADSASDP